MTDPRLLFLCHTLPYPPDGGVWIRSFHLLKELSRNFKVTALCFERAGSERHDPNEAARKLNRIADVRVFPLPQNERRWRRYTEHLVSLLTGRVFTVYRHMDGAFRDGLEEALQEARYDLVHVDSLDLSAHLPPLLSRAGLPIVCGHHNVESQLLRRRARAESNPLARWYVGWQAELQREEEKRWCGRVDLNVVVSEEDRETLRERSPGARVEVVPNGVDVSRYRPGQPAGAKQERIDLLFVGGAGWFPNRDGMEYFVTKILPLIRLADTSVSVVWVGSADEALREQFQRDHDVRMTGWVEDVRPYLQAARCLVVPLRVGGGSRLKILDGWAMGKAVVSTSQGCEGLTAKDEENILIRDEPEGFARAVLRVLRDRKLRDGLGESARDTAVQRYSWQRIGEKLVESYRALTE